MTYYDYLETMQELCLRASKALKVIKSDDPLISDVYDKAEEGFYRKKTICLVLDAQAPVEEAFLSRLSDFKTTVQKWEGAAAYESRYQGN